MQNIADRLVLLRIAQSIQKKEFVFGHNGSLSMRVNTGILITPSDVNKSFLRAQDLLLMDKNCKILSKDTTDIEQKLPLESCMHAKIYKNREDINGIIYSQALNAVLFSLLKEKLNIKKQLNDFLPKINSKKNYISISENELSPFDNGFEKTLSYSIEKNNIFLFKGNGVLNIGKNLCTAYNNLEQTEYLAKFAINYMKFINS